MIKIKTAPSAYFYSDRIYLTPGKSLEISEKAMSMTELQDTVEGYDAKQLEMSEAHVQIVREEYLNRKKGGGGCSSPPSGTATPPPSQDTPGDNTSSSSAEEDIEIPDFLETFRRNLQ